MEHPESLTTWDTKNAGGRQTIHNTEWNIQSLTTWDTQDTEGRQTIHNTEWNIQSHGQHGTQKTQEEGKQYTTRNGTSRVTNNMGHTRHRRKANNTQHGMKHPESLTTWDTQDTGGRQTIHNTE
jgi:hypothetical protein